MHKEGLDQAEELREWIEAKIVEYGDREEPTLRVVMCALIGAVGSMIIRTKQSLGSEDAEKIRHWAIGALERLPLNEPEP